MAAGPPTFENFPKIKNKKYFLFVYLFFVFEKNSSNISSSAGPQPYCRHRRIGCGPIELGMRLEFFDFEW
jgi:hypothetical protein